MRVSDRGFTLIESLVASGLVIAVCLGTAQLFVYAIAPARIARDQTLMGAAAKAKLEEISAAVAAGVLGTTSADALDRDVDACHDSIAQSGREYVRRWRIAEVPGYSVRAYAITVRVMPASGGSEVRLVGIHRTLGP